MKQLTITEQLNGDYFTLYDNDLGTILREFDGLEYASVRESIDDVAGPYGSVYVNSKQGKRIVTVKGDLVGSDVFSNRRMLLKALRQTGTIKLFQFTTYDDLLLQFEGEITKLLNPYNHKIHTFLIEIIAPDWRLYSQELFSQDIAITSVRGGAEIPAIIPMPIPLSTPPEDEVTNILTLSGNETTDPIFTINGPGTNIHIGNITTDKELIYNETLDSDDVLVIDIKNRTAILNGVDNAYPDITGDWWSLIPGENEISFLIDSGLDLELTNLNISYREAYNGI